MKSAEPKISSPASKQKSNKPFFGKGEESFFGNPVQAKLNIGKPGDPYEKEADAVADKVVQCMAAPPIQAKCDCCSHEDEKTQKKEDIGEEEQEVQPKPIFESNGENEVQRKGGGSDSNHSALEGQLNASRNSGSPMAPDVQQNMESSFGTNFNNVRIHDNDSAAGMNNSLNAQAFTNGSNIYFNKNKYNPKSSEGQHLLAHELTHVVQQGAAKKSSPSVQKTSDTVQCFPQAGEVLPATEMQQRFYKHRNEVVELQGNSKFSPSKGLAAWISSMWQNGQDVAVNVKWGSLGAGFIWLDKRSDMQSSTCIFTFLGKVCIDMIPSPSMYNAKCQVMPLNHPAFPQTDKGSVVMEICILGGNVSNRLGWVAGKKPDEIEPLLATGGVLDTTEAAFLPLIYGDDYTGENYVPGLYSNNYNNGFLAFASSGFLKLPNQQQIDGNLSLMGQTHSWLGQLQGAAKGLEKYDFKIERNPGKAEIYGEGVQFQLDKEWTGGDKDGERGAWSATAQFRASYKNRVFEFFGRATYASARISGEVNLAIVPKTKAEAIFRENAPGKKSTAGQAQPAIGPAPDIETSMEPLALTGYGNLSFKLVKKKTPAGQQGQGQQGQAQGAGGFPDIDLEGTGAFAVSPDGYVVLAGSLKFPTNWKFTPPYDYKSDDADDKSKHLFQKKATVIEYPVPPAGTVEGEVGITLDVKTHINPLELYDIEVSGVYSNHPEFRSEVNITPRLYIDGFADATVTIEATASARALGLIKAASVTGSLTGVANFKAYISAAPTISAIWDKDKDGGKPAQYAIAGAAHAAGLLTFTLTGGLSVDILYKEVWSKKDFQLGSWTLANFGVLLELQEYILGSDKKPQIDYSKIKFGQGQVRSIEDAIEGKKQKVKAEDPKGGFTQKENGKNVEKGTFSQTPPVRPDRNLDPLNNHQEQEFFMKDQLHELSITYSGTRGQPKALIEMASGEKEPLKTKIAEEKAVIDVMEGFTGDDTDKELEFRKRDLDNISRETDAVKKNAETAAEQTKEGEEPAVAGFEQLDDRLTNYANKYNTNDLGVDLSLTPKPKPPKGLKIPVSNGASPEMERRLMERRRIAGYAAFEDFKGVNVAVFQYHVLKPGRDVIDEQADGPFYEAAVNVAKDYHTEVLITGELEKIHRSPAFRKKYSPSHKIAVTEILTERSPCSSCQGFLGRQPSQLIITNNYHTFYLEHYSGNWIERNRNLMIRYGQEPPTWEELQKKYPGERLPDPH
jgi:hypothetical protein